MVATRFAVAVHILLLLAAERTDARPTSLRLAQSVNTNPVVVRRITGLLSRAGLVRVHRGPGGAELVRNASCITLSDVWRAVNPGKARPLLPLHARPDPLCPVGCSIQAVLGAAFGEAEHALHAALAQTTLDTLVSGVRARQAAA